MTSSKQAPSSNIQTASLYDLHDRTLAFALRVREFVKKLPKSIPNFEYARQLIRSSGSIGANYIEANEALSKKDFALRVKICRKESKETKYWLALVDVGADAELDTERKALWAESGEYVKIFSSMVNKAA